MDTNDINIYTPEEFKKISLAAKLAAETLCFIEEYIKPGVSTNKINNLCHDFIVKNKGIPAPLNYKQFPKSICTSVNEVVCHGIPSNTEILQSGDIVNIDVSVNLNGWYGDTSKTFPVGTISDSTQKLLNTTHECLMLGIQQVRPENTLGDIGYAIWTHATKNHYSVVVEYCGHGIGSNFHESPLVKHIGHPKQGIILKPGMCFTIEPMLNAGTKQTKVLSDNWTVITADKSLSAQYEHTIGVTQDGFIIFSKK